jgi:hypothetical protein
MHAFDFVVILVSFIYALALTHLLSRIGALILASVRIAPLVLLVAVNAAWAVFFSWLGLWGLHAMTNWDIGSILAQFAFAIGLYFICVFAAPGAEQGKTDTEAFYWAQYRRFYWSYIITITVGIAANTTFLESSDPSLFLKWNIASFPMYLPCILALTVKSRWAQWAAGIGLFAVTAAFALPIEMRIG